MSEEKQKHPFLRDTICGLYFLTLGEDKKIKEQGRIMCAINECYYACIIFSWLDGSQMYHKIYHISTISDFLLFDDVEHLEYYNNNWTTKFKKNNVFDKMMEQEMKNVEEHLLKIERRRNDK